MIITVPLETIPLKVSEILNQMADQLDTVTQVLFHSADDIKNKNDILMCLELLDDCRKKLSTVDLNIEDCYNTLKGYVKYNYELRDNEQENNNEILQQGPNS